MADKLRLIYAVRESLRVAEEQALILVKLEIGNQAEVRPEAGDPLANIILEGSFNVANLLQIVEVAWRRCSWNPSPRP